MEVSELDIAFLHAGGKNIEGLQGPIIPIGMLGIASYLDNDNYKVKIYNCLLEKVLDEQLTDEKILEKIKAKLYCVDLHWFVHSYECIELAKLIKRIHTNAYVAIGGLTSSYFAVEIIQNHPCIDFIVKGESEEPYRILLEKIKEDKKDYAEVPNLTYRLQEEPKDNAITYCIDQESFDTIDFLKFDLLSNWKKCFHLQNVDYSYNRNSECTIKEYYEIRNSFWIVCTGRGCNFNCSICGGSKNAFKRSFNRNTLILRNPERVAEDIVKLDEMGIKQIYIPHSPLVVNHEYHKNLIKSIRKKKDKLNCGFVMEDIPFYFDEEVHRMYLETFNPIASIYILYLGSINKKVAIKNKLYFPMEYVQGIIHLTREYHTKLKLGMTLGLPGEDLMATLQQALYAKKFKQIGLNVDLYTAELHPASNVFAEPERYGVTLGIKCFEDYYNKCKNKVDKSMIVGFELNTGVNVSEQYEMISAMLAQQSQ